MDSPFIPFYEQMVRNIIHSNNIYLISVLKKSDTGNAQVMTAENNRYRKMDASELTGYCKNLLKQYLNHENYLKSLDAEDGIYIGETWINKDTLMSAHKSEYTLAKEIKILKREIFSTRELYREKGFFSVPNNTLPCQNGYYDFESGKFFPYDDRLKVAANQINANYIEKYARDALPSAFSRIIYNGVSENISFDVSHDRCESFLDCLAYAFLQKNFARKLFMIIGPTKSGKSTLVNIMRSVFGDFGIALNSHSIMRRPIQRDGELRADMYDAMDKLWIDISELDERQILDSGMIKTFTGQDKTNVRLPYSKERVSTEMNGKIFIVTNFYPKLINYSDAAFLDRLVIIDWHNTVDEWSVDDKLYDKLTTQEMRDRIFTFFIGRAQKIYGAGRLNIHRSFLYNTVKYFLSRGDMVAKFYDETVFKMPNNNKYYRPDQIFQCFTIYLNLLKLNDEKYTNMRMRSFNMQFSAIVKSDTMGIVQRVHTSLGNFYTGLDLILFYGMHPVFPNGLPQFDTYTTPKQYRDANSTRGPSDRRGSIFGRGDVWGDG
jgi:phage/plasmid-associated DNA primase